MSQYVYIGSTYYIHNYALIEANAINVNFPCKTLDDICGLMQYFSNGVTAVLH